MTTATETPTVEPEVEEIPDAVETLDWNNDTFNVLETTLKKGKGNGRVVHILQPNQDEDLATFHGRFRSAVGAENWDKEVQKLIRRASMDATEEALATSADGKVHESAFVQELTKWFTTESRRHGELKKDLQEKIISIYADLTALWAKHFKALKNEGPKLAPDEEAKMMQLTATYSELHQKIEDKTRKGKAKK